MTATSPVPSGSPQDFSRLIDPRAVAVVGASSNLARIGGQPLRLLTEYGFQGKVYPVNPKYEEINGLPCYPNIAAVPRPCDVALIALPAPHVPGVIEQCGAVGIPFAIVLSSGFSEVGAQGAALQQQLVAAARAGGVRVIGPNCLGVLNVKKNVRNGFGGTMRQAYVPGPFAMVTQSGGFGFGVLGIATSYGVGFNYAMTTGNEADITMLELVEYLLERDDVEGVFVFMEGAGDGRRLIAIGQRALELGKPIFVWKIGNSAVGRRAAASHSARMIAGPELFHAAFRHGGFVEIRDTEDLIDTLRLVSVRRLPRGRRVGIVSPSGGAGVLFADLCIEHGLEVPQLAEATTAELRSFMAAYASVANPVDATASGNNDNYASYNRLIAAVLADPNVDQLIVRTPSAAGMVLANGLVEIARASGKPVMIDWPTASNANVEVMRLLNENHVPCMLSPGRAVRALAALNDFAQKKRGFNERPREQAARITPKQALDLPTAGGTLGEHRSKQLLQAYGIPAVSEKLLSIEAVARLEQAPLPFPLAVKMESADIPHKTEAGVVRLGIRTLEELKSAARDIANAARAYDPDARIDGISLQEMASGLEVIVGAADDPCFGPVVLFGLGGIYTELLKDVTHGFAPFGIDYARHMIDSIRGSALLHGFRGRPPLDIDALAGALSRVSLLIADHAGRIGEIDINPLFVRPAGQGVVAADALVVLR